MLPDFLCIGAQKSGTTWLHHNLAQHPLVWLPPTKAIHYFDWPPTSLFERVFGRKGRLREARAHLVKTLTRTLSGRAQADELGWAVRFCLAPRSDGWYESLFRRPTGAIAGETTPSYCLLPAQTICRIHELMPNARVIYLVRHPVERAWSAAVMHFNDKSRGGIDNNDPEAIAAWLNRPKTNQRCDYASTIVRWRARFGDNLLVCFYEELRSDPESLLKKVQSFLELPIHIPEDVAARRNPGNWSQVPVPFRQLLQDRYRKAMEELHSVMPGPVTKEWLTRYAKAD